jgi:hypothetical protein
MLFYLKKKITKNKEKKLLNDDDMIGIYLSNKFEVFQFSPFQVLLSVYKDNTDKEIQLRGRKISLKVFLLL